MNVCGTGEEEEVKPLGRSTRKNPNKQTDPYDTALLSTQMFSNFLFEAADCSARHFFVCLREQKEGLRKLWEMNDVCQCVQVTGEATMTSDDDIAATSAPSCATYCSEYSLGSDGTWFGWQ